MSPWLHVIGMGEDGLAGLSAEAADRLSRAEVVFASDRLHALVPSLSADRRYWPSPFSALIDDLVALKGRQVAVLATGDPLWYSVGARIGREIGTAQIAYHPQLSAFQLAAARMGWSLADVETLTAHGRAAEQVLPFVAPNQRLIVLSGDAQTPVRLAELLTERGYGPSRMTALAHLGGPSEAQVDGTAADWATPVPDFHTLAIDCVAGPGARLLPRVPGLPDDAFRHDGKITKREIRALTLAKLAPTRGARLWDVGSGCGSIGIEWMRAARDAHAIGIDPDPDRRAIAAHNATTLGTPRLELIDGRAPEALLTLPLPDAVFLGGGISAEAADTALGALPIGGRLVANAVTLESEGVLLDLHEKLGGDLVRLSVARARPVGPRRGWAAAMPVTQWSLTKS